MKHLFGDEQFYHLNCFSHLNWPSLFFEDEHLYRVSVEGSKRPNCVFQQVITFNPFSLKGLVCSTCAGSLKWGDRHAIKESW
jgi:hypothetical protein